MVGKSGRVIAVDLQEGMLQRLRHKIRETKIEERITLHRCKDNKIGLSEKVDFALAFYVIHEIPNQGEFFKELFSIQNDRDENTPLIKESKVDFSIIPMSDDGNNEIKEIPLNKGEKSLLAKLEEQINLARGENKDNLESDIEKYKHKESSKQEI